MSTLQVNDPRSRGRSKSPSGRIRERSQSRINREVSPTPELSKRPLKKYYDSDSADEKRRYVSSDAKRSSRSYKASSTYDLPDSDEDQYRARERTKDRYYHSESEDDAKRRAAESRLKPQSRYRSDSEDNKKYRSSGHRHSPTYDSDSDSLTDSDMEALAYGDSHAIPPRGHRPSASADLRTSADPRSSRESFTKSSKKPSASYHLGDDSDHGPLGSHPSYARPEQFSYAQHTQYAPSQPSEFLSNRRASYNGAPPATLPPNWVPIPECEMPGYVPPSSQPPMTQTLPGAFPAPVPPMPPMPPATRPPDAYTQGYAGSHPYANPPQWQYAQPDPNIKYTSKSARQPYTQSNENQFVKPYTQSNEPQFVEIAPGSRTDGSRHRPHSLSVSSNLSAGGLAPGGLGTGGRPPASPLLEAYQGTYQSISPMPSPIASPMVFPRARDDDISDVEPLGGSGSDRRRKHKSSKSRDEKDRKDKKEKERERDRKHGLSSRNGGAEEVILISPSSRKQVSFYSPVKDAIALKEALSHHTSADSQTLIDILPHLTSDEILALRGEYKNHAKVHGKGINIAKHIKVKLGSSSFGKVCYATALGRWESEAYWANCYYQTGTSRRELLIESLIGRSNSDIREIKNSFRDTRYNDNLERCMKAELKADKFRTAILLALEERRQPEKDTIDKHMVQRDVQELHRALVAREGGETAMIYIIVLRSDSHLRETLRLYESIYKQNFARAMIAKSRNLVGETLTHILNGAVNRPMRDALLLHQAIRESRSGRERSELLISRLVRLHWEPRHLENVKSEYRKRYGERVEEAIAQEVITSTNGSDWGEFCIELARSSTELSSSVGGRK